MKAKVKEFNICVFRTKEKSSGWFWRVERDSLKDGDDELTASGYRKSKSEAEAFVRAIVRALGGKIEEDK